MEAKSIFFLLFPNPNLIMVINWMVFVIVFNIFFACEYYLKFAKLTVQKLSAESIFIKGLGLASLNSIPKFILASLLLNREYAVQTVALTNNVLILVTAIFGITLVFSSRISILNSFIMYKNIMQIEISSLIMLLIMKSEVKILDKHYLCMIVGIIYFFVNTYNTPAYLRLSTDIGPNELDVSNRIKKITDFFYYFKKIFDNLTIDISKLSSEYAPFSTIFSPLANFLIYSFYLNAKLSLYAILAFSASLLFSGIFLHLTMRKKAFTPLIYFYTALANFSMILFLLSESLSLIKYFVQTYGIGENFMSGTFMTWFVSVLDIVTCYDYSAKGYTSIPVLSILYQPVVLVFGHGLFIKPFTIYNSEKITEIITEPLILFTIAFLIISMPVIFVNFVIRHQKLTKDLGIILLIIYGLFVLSLCMEGSKVICK